MARTLALNASRAASCARCAASATCFSASRSLSATVPATETLASSAAFWASSVARSVASVPEAQALKTLRLMSLALSITFDDGSLWAFGSAMPRFSFPYGGGFDDRDPPEDSSSGCVNETLTGCRPRGTVTRSPLSRGGTAGDTTRHHFSGTAVVVAEETGGLNVGRRKRRQRRHDRGHRGHARYSPRGWQGVFPIAQ